MSLLTRSSVRYLTGHPWLSVLSLVGVALGVAVVVGIDLANSSAERAFELSAEAVTGRATHQVVGPAGTVTDSIYRRLRLEDGVRASAPVVEGYATVPEANRTLQLLGIDPFAEAPFRPYVAPGSGIELGTFIPPPDQEAPYSGVLAASTAEALGVEVGDTLAVRVEGTDRSIRIAGVIAPEGTRGRRAVDDLLIVDVATAQTMLQLSGRLSRIDLRLTEDGQGGRSLDARVADLQRRLPEGVRVERSETRTQTVQQLTSAFELNLQALSLLALVVGGFLIYNTMTFSVVQRRALIGRLRALGVTRGEIFRLVLGEAAIIGVLGTAAGLVVGALLAEGLVHLVTRTINDLYFVVSVREVTLAPWSLLKGALLGLGTTLVGAVPPAYEATRSAVSLVLQRSEVESRTRAVVPRLVWTGIGLAAAGGGIFLIPSRSVVLGYAGILALILSAAVFTPAAVLAGARLLRPLAERLFGVVGRMAARSVERTLSRTGIAVAALTVAIAATVGVGVMVESFRGTVEGWLTHTLRADVYVQPPGGMARRAESDLDPRVVERMRSVPGVEAIATIRRTEVESEYGLARLIAVDPTDETERAYRFVDGEAPAIWASLRAEPGVIVSEPYQYRHRVGVGDSLTILTDRGREDVPVRGVFYDYGSGRGVVVMARSSYERFYDDRGISGAAAVAAPDVSAERVAEEIRERAGPIQQVSVRSNRALREASLRIFDRTFTITSVLRLLAIGVAFVGIVSALMALQLERRRELAIMRANGLTGGQLGGLVTVQTGITGLLAGLFAIPLGLVLAYGLVFVINKRSFGWTLELVVGGDLLLQGVLIGLVAALLAGAYPAYTMRRVDPAEVLR